MIDAKLQANTEQGATTVDLNAHFFTPAFMYNNPQKSYLELLDGINEQRAESVDL